MILRTHDIYFDFNFLKWSDILDVSKVYTVLCIYVYMYIYLMYVAQDSIFIISYHIYSKLLMILFSNKWCLFKATSFWKTMLVVIFSKILHHRFLPTIYKNLKPVFLLMLVGQRKMRKLACLFDLSNRKY